MKYIIMCGGHYKQWSTPKQLTSLGAETILDRTVRLLKENGVKDISVTTNNHAFDNSKHNILWWDGNGRWLGGFYPTDEPTCYLFGDVVFSENAIKTIINTETDDIAFFASAPPFDRQYSKKFAEPFAFKVQNTQRFRKCIDAALSYKGWMREPIAWELWQVIKNTPYNKIDYTNYTVINDFTVDVDSPNDMTSVLWNALADERGSTNYMIHAYPKRMWYVEEYLIPSMLSQGIDRNNIVVYNDSNGKGNLRACMDAFGQCLGAGGTWHLQDDVCICKDFKERTEWYDYGLVCGFSSALYDGSSKEKQGAVRRSNMWFSFPCIRIPNQWARECSEWVSEYIIGNPVYRHYWQGGSNDDWAFRTYLKEFHKDVVALNIMPNLVDHVDYLIGGGSRSKRTKPCRAQYWDKDDDSVEKLEEWLKLR